MTQNVIADHEAASLFPLMGEDRFSELVESIRETGLLHEIVLHEDKILDGRNRYRACLEADIEPRFETFDGNPFDYVWSANGQRRDLILDQRAQIFLEALERSETWQTQRAVIDEEANRKRSEAAKEQPRAEDGEFAAGEATTCGSTRSDPDKKASTILAKLSGTNRGAIERAQTLRSKRPDLALKVISGEMRPTAARREMKRAEVAAKVKALPTGKYRVLYADPPWQYNDSREGLGTGEGQKIDRASTAAKDHYPPMPMAELRALDVNALADSDAVLFCWATFPLLPDQIEVVRAWGFKYKTAFVWDKRRGSFGHYHKAEAELLLVCTRGSCTPDCDSKPNQVQSFPRTKHSRKPEEFRALIESLYQHGQRIELFRRGSAPPGWDIWGAEIETPEKAEAA